LHWQSLPLDVPSHSFIHTGLIVGEGVLSGTGFERNEMGGTLLFRNQVVKGKKPGGDGA
jgi:hypothetical protein